EGLDLDALNEFGRKPGAQFGGKLVDEVERTMRITSGRIALEVASPDPPSRAKIGRDGSRVKGAAINLAEDGSGGVCFPAETGGSQRERLEAGAATVAAVDSAYSGAVLERVAAGGDAKGHGDIRRRLDGTDIVMAQLGQRQSSSQGTVGAMRMDGE